MANTPIIHATQDWVTEQFGSTGLRTFTVPWLHFDQFLGSAAEGEDRWTTCGILKVQADEATVPVYYYIIEIADTSSDNPSCQYLFDNEGNIQKRIYGYDLDDVLGWSEWETVTDVDQTYKPTSLNAQSGKAVAEAITKTTVVDLGIIDLSSFNEVVDYFETNEDVLSYDSAIFKYMYAASNACHGYVIQTRGDVGDGWGYVQYFFDTDGFIERRGEVVWDESLEEQRLVWTTKDLRPRVDTTYKPTSDNAQSGKAVAEAIASVSTGSSGGSLSIQIGRFEDWDSEAGDYIRQFSCETSIEEIITAFKAHGNVTMRIYDTGNGDYYDNYIYQMTGYNEAEAEVYFTNPEGSTFNKTVWNNTELSQFETTQPNYQTLIGKPITISKHDLETIEEIDNYYFVDDAQTEAVCTGIITSTNTRYFLFSSAHNITFIEDQDIHAFDIKQELHIVGQPVLQRTGRMDGITEWTSWEYVPMMITSPNGTKYKITVENDGTLVTERI